MSCLRCEHLTFAYENQVVVSDLSFTVEDGDYLCIIGENGTGKSTLMKGILGLKKPVSGTIVTGEGISQTQIGYVPQFGRIQKDFPASVWEVVLSGCLGSRGILPGFGGKEKKLAEQKLKLLGIFDLKARSFGELSGGQRQRVLLARSLCAAKKLILLDEPTTGLDPVATEEFYRLIAELNRKHQITVIMISHAIKEAVTYADHILYLSHKNSFFGTTQDFCDSESGRAFLQNCAEI